MRLYLGEYWLDTGIGVDWIGRVLARGATPALIKSLIAAAIAETPDVTRVVNVAFAVDAATRIGRTTYSVASPEALGGTTTGTVSV